MLGYHISGILDGETAWLSRIGGFLGWRKDRSDAGLFSKENLDELLKNIARQYRVKRLTVHRAGEDPYKAYDRAMRGI